MCWWGRVGGRVGDRVCRNIVAMEREWSTRTIVLQSYGYGLYGFS